MKDFDKKKWAKRAAFFAVFGVTGAAVVLSVNFYRSMKGLEELDWDNIKL